MSSIQLPVILSEEIAQVVNEGGSVIVICLESVSRKGTGLKGKWIYEVVSADRKSRRLVIYKMRTEAETSLSVVGVASKTMSWGLPGIHVPPKKGQTFELFADGRCLADWRSDT